MAGAGGAAYAAAGAAPGAAGAAYAAAGAVAGAAGAAYSATGAAAGAAGADWHAVERCGQPRYQHVAQTMCPKIVYCSPHVQGAQG